MRPSGAIARRDGAHSPLDGEVPRRLFHAAADQVNPDHVRLRQYPGRLLKCAAATITISVGRKRYTIW